MSHFPVNHHLQPLYRVLAGLCGLYVLVFGVVALFQATDLSFFAQDGLPTVLGLRANRAFAVLSIVAGIVLLGGAVIGGNLDRSINLVASFAFLIAGMAMMILMQTDANFLGFTMATCVVSFVLGLILLAAALYGRVGTRREEALEEGFRHGQRSDPEEHAWQTEQPAT